MLIFKRTIRLFVFKNLLFFVGELGVAYIRLSCFIDKIQIYFSKSFLSVKIMNDITENMRIKTKLLFLIKQKLLLLNNLFKQKLMVFGVGFRCWTFHMKKIFISLKLGYSNDFCIALPPCIKIICLKASLVLLKSYNLVKLYQFVSFLRKLRITDVYKGKGIMPINECFSFKERKSSK